jgi:uncharacterized protein (DUF4415 family)/uncharacterized DUF497 family protein
LPSNLFVATYKFAAAKSERNARERGLPFHLVEELDWGSAVYSEDVRFPYPEARFIALGFIGARLYVVCFTPISGGIRVISFRKPMIARSVGMKRKPLTNKAGEVRELLAEDIRAMRPMAEVLPAELVRVIENRKRGERGPQKAPTKQQVTLRLDRDVIERFRATGRGWQSRVNEALRKARVG